MEDEGSDRPAKKTSNENNKVKEQINSVDDRDDLTQSSETASEDGELLYYKNSMLLIEQLDTGCKAETGTAMERVIPQKHSSNSHLLSITVTCPNSVDAD
ncbi:hypothetical protein E5288_WYG022333 [Bos mutus]|uniref:Uncharacterized protein n=1 Tax=Bos mutus TaxID=72004 RepID=A0A6B0RUC8_9CETA|nr:hypothetical protein [Bos mutus]